MNGKRVAKLTAEFRKTHQPRKQMHTDDRGELITVNNWRRFKRKASK